MNSSPRVGIISMILLVFVALIADVITLIPIAGDIIGPVYWVALTFFLWMKGFGWFNFRRAVPTVLSIVGELIPAVQALPTILAGTVVVLFMLKAQEKTGISAKGIATGKVNPQQARQALYQNGKRQPTPPPLPEGSRNPNTKPLVSDGVRAPQK